MTTDQGASPTSGDTTEPAQAVELYLETRSDDVTETTLRSHRYRLNHFVRWCEDIRGIEDLSTLTGQRLHEYRLWRREDGDLNVVSLHTQLATLRVFIKFCESISIVPKGLHEQMMIPRPSKKEQRSDESISTERAEAILDWLETYEYASFDHVLFQLIWKTGMRIGAARSLDLDDFDRQEGRLHFTHRPEGGTSLKNGEAGQRVVALSAETATVLTDYIEHSRPSITEENGREPILATSKGRPSTSTLRCHVYRITQPCQRQNECPHDRSMADCPDIGYASSAGCPSSCGPHAVRTGAISHFLQSDVPKEIVSGRMDVSEKVIDQHYDVRGEESKAEQRRQYLDQV